MPSSKTWTRAAAGAGLALAATFAACGESDQGETVTCGPGTVKQGGSCVGVGAGGAAGGGGGGQGGAITCGTGTKLQGTTCVADIPEAGAPDAGKTLTCGPQTHEESGKCVPDPASLGNEWGVYTLEKYDASGPDRLPNAKNHKYLYANSGISFGATATKNGVHVFDYDAIAACIGSKTGCPPNNTFLPIVSQEIETPILQGQTSTKFSSHGIALSPDAKWVYLPFLVPYARYSFVDYSATQPEPATFFYKIDARTLKLAKKINCGGPTHHINITADKYMLVDCYGKAGAAWIDPNKDDELVKVFPWGKFEGYPYESYESPPLAFMDPAKKPRYQATSVIAHLNAYKTPDGKDHEVPGYVSYINTDTMKEEGAVVTGPFPIWVIFSKDGTRSWSTAADSDRVYRIDLAKNPQTNKLKATLAAVTRVGPGPYGLTLSDDEKRLFVNDKAEGVRAGSTTVHGSTITVVDVDPTSPTYDKVLYTIGLSTDAVTAPQRPDHAYWGPDGNLWSCANANQSCWVLDPKVTPQNGGTMTKCTRIRKTEDVPACTSDAGCPTGMPCQNGLCGGTMVIKETIDCMAAPVLANLRMPDKGEVTGWNVGRGDPHSLVWVSYDANGVGKVVKDFTAH